MPLRAPRIDPELKAHQEWLGYLQPRGLVVAPAAMQEAGWVLEQGGRELIEQQEQFREALQPLHPEPDDADDSGEEEPVLGFRQLDALLVEQLNWDAEAMQREPAVLEVWTLVVAGFGDDNKPQLLIQELVPLADGRVTPSRSLQSSRLLIWATRAIAWLLLWTAVRWVS